MGIETMITITIPGAPVAKGRPRFARRGNFTVAYTPEKTRSYEAIVAIEGKVAMARRKPLEGALRVEIEAYMPIPKSTTKMVLALMEAGKWPHIKKPDCDNLAKICDALNGICWLDDSQIVQLTIAKLYSHRPRLVITISATA